MTNESHNKTLKSSSRRRKRIIHAPRTSLGACGFNKSKLPPRAGLICAPLIHLHSVCNFKTRVITPLVLFANTLGADRKIHTQLKMRREREEEEAVLCAEQPESFAAARTTNNGSGRQTGFNKRSRSLGLFITHTLAAARSLSHINVCMYIESGRALCGPLLRINKRWRLPARARIYKRSMRGTCCLTWATQLTLPYLFAPPGHTTLITANIDAALHQLLYIGDYIMYGRGRWETKLSSCAAI